MSSIVVVTHNSLKYTRQCIESVQDRTDVPFEIIVVDNGSTDGTPEFIHALGGIRLIQNAANEGFPRAANQGILAATGEFVVLLNNDTLVTPGWLGRLVNALTQDPGGKGQAKCLHGGARFACTDDIKIAVADSTANHGVVRISLPEISSPLSPWRTLPIP